MSFHYMALARKDGSNREFRQLHSLGIRSSPDEVMQAAVNRVRADARFRKRFEGWQIVPLIVDYVLKIEPNGSVVLHKNESEGVKA